MKEIIRILRAGNVKSMVLEGSASPEGPAKGNERLAKGRVENLKDYILGMFPEMEGKIAVVTKKSTTDATDEENYASMRYARILSMEVEEESAKAEEENDAVNTPSESTEGTIVSDGSESTDKSDISEDGNDSKTAAETSLIPDTTTQKEKRPLNTVAALKTNLLFDAVTALNFEVEVPIGKRFSVMVEDVFPWWETGNKYWVCL